MVIKIFILEGLKAAVSVLVVLGTGQDNRRDFLSINSY